MLYKGGDIHEGQEEIINGIISDGKMYNIVVVGRQFGKTYMLEQVILYYALNNPGYKCLWISPSIKQFNKVKKELIAGMDGSGAIKHVNNQDSIITLINDSTIMFGSSESYDKLRGESIDVMIGDEFAFVSENIFNEILRPMLLVRGKKCILSSTPKGLNFFYKLSLMELNDERFKTYRSDKKNPFQNDEEIESARRTLPPDIFKQEYLGEFISNGGTVFGNVDDVCILNNYKDPTMNDRYYCGIDLGNQVDFTCMTIFNRNGECVYIYRNNRQDWDKMIDEMRIILNKYKPTTFIEVNFNDAVFNFLQKGCYAKLIPFYTTNKSKQNIIEELILSFNEKRVKLPNEKLCPELFSEIQTFGFEYSPAKRMVVYRAMESAHDDLIMSTALANSVFIEYKNKGKLRIL